MKFGGKIRSKPIRSPDRQNREKSVYVVNEFRHKKG